MANYYVGVDVGGTKIAAALVDMPGHIIAQDKVATIPKGSPDEIANQIVSIIQTLVKNHLQKNDTLRGIGLGIPGVISPDYKEIQITPNINLTKYPLAHFLEGVFQVPVVLGNDVNLGLLGELWLGAGGEVKNLIGLFPGTGVGGAIIINGQLITGSQGAAGELGHVIIEQGSSKTSAGLKGTVEALASRRAIERDIREAVKKGEKTVVTEIMGDDLSIIKSKVIAEAIKLKDPVVLGVIDKACQALANMCISMRHALNPDKIIFGGGLIEACGQYMIPKIQKISDSSPFFKNIDNCKIVASYLGDDAVLLGAVYLIKQVLGDEAVPISEYYPRANVKEKNTIEVQGEEYKNSFYIRADSKVKTIDEENEFTKFHKTNKIDVSTVSKLCKKHPEFLVIGTNGTPVRVTKKAEKWLITQAITYRIAPINKAVELYNNLDKRKVLVVKH